LLTVKHDKCICKGREGNTVMGSGMMNGNMGFWMFFNMLFWILLLVGIVFLVVWAVQRVGGKGGSAEESALDILKKRYARGEISKEEYAEKKRDIVQTKY
jgi:putative membrane protein